MAVYQPFTTLRAIEPDPVRLVEALRSAIDPTIGVQHQAGDTRYVLKRNGDVLWTDPELVTAQQILDTAVNQTSTTRAETRIDTYPAEIQALMLVLLDQINVLRVRAGLTQITPAQAVQAIKDKLAAIVSRAV